MQRRLGYTTRYSRCASRLRDDAGAASPTAPAAAPTVAPIAANPANRQAACLASSLGLAKSGHFARNRAISPSAWRNRPQFTPPSVRSFTSRTILLYTQHRHSLKALTSAPSPCRRGHLGRRRDHGRLDHGTHGGHGGCVHGSGTRSARDPSRSRMPRRGRSRPAGSHTSPVIPRGGHGTWAPRTPTRGWGVGWVLHDPVRRTCIGRRTSRSESLPGAGRKSQGAPPRPTPH